MAPIAYYSFINIKGGLDGLKRDGFLTSKNQIKTWLLQTGTWLGACAILIFYALANTQGNFVYPLDDTYIHLSIAERIGHTGNWGPSEFQFQFSSSSPAFTVLLSVLLPLLGFNELIPLLINLIFGGLFIWITIKLSNQSILSRGWRAVALIVVNLLIPLHLLLLLGMEHLAHLFFAILFLREASRKLALPKTHPNGLLVISAILMCLFRYEGLFLLGGFFLVAFFQRNFKIATFTVLLAILPLGVLGTYMAANGGTILPISILGKASGVKLFEGELVLWLSRAAENLYQNPFIYSLLIGNILLLFFNIRKELQVWIWIFLLATGFHIFLAEIGGYRYEAYLIGIGLISFLQFNVPKMDRPLISIYQSQVLVALFALFLFPLLLRTAFFTANYPVFCQNIYQQPVKAGKFLERYYQGESVGMNDIGAGSYFGKVKLTDLVGIGDQAVYAYRRAGNYDAKVIDNLVKQRQIRIAVIHDIWLEEWRPSSWIKVATWTIPNNLICADKTLSFYACEQEEVPYLKESLIAYQQASLPPEVTLKLFVE